MMRSLTSHIPSQPVYRGVRDRKSRGRLPVGRNASASNAQLVAPGKKDLTGQLLQSIFKLALQSRLKSHGTVDVDAVCDTRSLLEGVFNGINITGTNWVTPLQLTAKLLQVEFGEMHLDLSTLLWQRRVALLNIPRGYVRIVLTAEDLSNFMVHPLMSNAASKAVQAQPFLFQQDSVVINAQQVLFSGAWQGRTYDVIMSPVTGSGYGRDESALQVTANVAGGGTVGEGGSAVALGLAQFFGSLELDLQGIEISRPSLTLATSSRDAVEQHLLEIQMNVQLRALPPLNMKF